MFDLFVLLYLLLCTVICIPVLFLVRSPYFECCCILFPGAWGLVKCFAERKKRERTLLLLSFLLTSFVFLLNFLKFGQGFAPRLIQFFSISCKRYRVEPFALFCWYYMEWRRVLATSRSKKKNDEKCCVFSQAGPRWKQQRESTFQQAKMGVC